MRFSPWYILLLALSAVAQAETFTVNTNSDQGAGSLREAITMANADPTTPRVINFAIGSGLQTISLASALPEIGRVMTIDGTTQNGFAGTPLIVIDGGGTVDADGLSVNYRGDFSAGPVFRGLCIVRFGVDGGAARNGINLIACDSATVTGCFIGISPTGTTAMRNTGAGIRHQAGSAVPAIYGGTTSAERNVISGNLGAGVLVESTFVNVIGNFIGTSADGLSAVPNGGDGVLITTNTATAVKIGTTTAGAGNVISGNRGSGLHILKRSATVQGNLIGLGADGVTALGNASHGIFVEVESSTLGDTLAGAANVISSNGGDGVRIDSTSGTSTPIRGSRIGTDSAGLLARGNAGFGINVIAGQSSVSNDQVCANGLGGVRIAAGKASALNNLIGVDAPATSALGNHGDGIAVLNAQPNLATQRDFAGNTIGGNTGAGISFGTGASGFYVKGNFIGTNSAGTAVLGNGGPGIRIFGGAKDEVIGTLQAGDRNVIVNNVGDGVEMDDNNQITGNSIFNNGGLAIDLLPNAVNPPTLNGLLNPPLVTAATVGPSTVDITFTHDAQPSTEYTSFFYLNDTPDPSGSGELQTPLGQQTWTTNGSGHFAGAGQFQKPSGTPATAIVTCVVNTGNLSSGTIKTSEAGRNFPQGTTPPPPTIGETTGNTNFAGNTNEPISTFTGELFDLEAVDLNLRGPMPLHFARYYASKIGSDGSLTSSLGRNRLHNFDAKLTAEETTAAVTLSNGRIVQFTKMGRAWVLTGRKDVAYQLVQSGTAYLLADPRSQIVRTFDATGLLTKIEDGRGNAHTLTYTGTRISSVEDGLGRTLAFTYDSNEHLVGVSDGVRSVVFTYSAADLASATDPLGHTTTFSYDGSGHLLSTMRPRTNAPYSQTYVAERVSSQVEHLAAGITNSTTLAYDTQTHATTITDPTGEKRVHTHTATGELTGFLDEASRGITMTYDASSRRASVADRLGRKTLISYHAASGKPSEVVESDGAVISFQYKARVLNGITFFDLEKLVLPEKTMHAFIHDAKGNLVTAIDSLGKRWRFTYDAHGQVLTMQNPTGGVVTYTYDTRENLVGRKDSDSGIMATTYAYDAFSRLTQIVHPDGAQTAIVYDDADRITSITVQRAGELSRTYSYTYDANDNVTVITDPSNATTQYAYDALDRVTRITDRIGSPRSRTFDVRGEVSLLMDELNQSTTIAHDARLRLTGVTDAGNETMSFGYNDEAELTSISDPLGHTTALARNKRGRVTAAIDPLEHTMQWERDALQRITRIIEPTGRQATLAYDKRSLLTGASRDGMGVASYARDAAGRLTRITDLNRGRWSFVYTPMGRVSASKDPLGNSTSFQYDARGRVARIALPDGETCAITRDEAGELARLTFSRDAGLMLGYTYDQLGRLIGANGITLSRDGEGRITNSQQAGVNFSATHDAAGRLVSVAYNNSYVVTYAYDSRNRLVAVTDNNASGANSVAFQYDAAGRMTGMTRSNGVSGTYTYDNANRLTRIQEGTFLDLKYTLNADGEVTTTDYMAPLVPGTTAETKSFKYDAASQVKGAEYGYDARGRITTAPGHTFGWDGASRLVALDSITLGYDGIGDAVTRTVGGVTTRFFYHHAIAMHPLVAERAEANSTFLRYYVWTPGGRLLYAVDAASGVPSFYHCDRVGSTLALSDGSGAVTDKYAYSPYGALLGGEGTSSQPFTFAGAIGVRTEGPLYQMRARYYDPATGRFLSRDPGGPRLRDVRTLDPYLYALGNPTRYVDPEGAAPVDSVRGEALAAGGLFGPASEEDKRLAGAFIVLSMGGPQFLAAIEESSAKDDDLRARRSAAVALAGGNSELFAYFADVLIRGGDGIPYGGTVVTKVEQPNVYPNNAETAVKTRASGEFVLNALEVTRAALGFEKTFLDGDASFGVRLPFLAPNDAAGPVGADVGDLSFAVKYAILHDRSSGGVVGAGLNVQVPQGSNGAGGSAVLPLQIDSQYSPSNRLDFGVDLTIQGGGSPRVTVQPSTHDLFSGQRF